MDLAVRRPARPVLLPRIGGRGSGLSGGFLRLGGHRSSQSGALVGRDLSLLVVLLFWAGRRDWRTGAILAGMLAGFGPWFLYSQRTMFFFYTITFEPFMILSLTFVLALALGGVGASVARRRIGLIGVTAFLAVVVLVSAFFWPVWTGHTIPYEAWRLRLWMPSWG